MGVVVQQFRLSTGPHRCRKEEEEEEEGCHGGRLPPRKGEGVGLVGEIGDVLRCEQTQVWWVVEVEV